MDSDTDVSPLREPSCEEGFDIFGQALMLLIIDRINISGNKSYRFSLSLEVLVTDIVYANLCPTVRTD